MRARVRRVRLRQDHGDEAGERVGALVLPGGRSRDACWWTGATWPTSKAGRWPHAWARCSRTRARSSSTWIPRARWRFRWRAWRGPRSAYASARTIPSASWGWRSWPTAASFRCRAARSSASRTPARGRPSADSLAGRADVELGRSGHRGAAALPAGREGAGRGRARGRASPVVAGRRGRRGGGHGGGAHRAALRRRDVSGAAVVGGARPGAAGARFGRRAGARAAGAGRCARAAGAPRAPARRARLVRQARGAARRRPRPARGRSGGARGRQRRGEVHPVPHHRGAASGKRGHDDDRR